MDVQRLESTPVWEWPPEAKPTILTLLRQSDAPVAERRVAATLAGDYAVIDDALAQVLVEVVEDARGDTELRGRAAISLGPVLEAAYDEAGTEEPDLPVSAAVIERVRAALRGLYEDGHVPKEVRRRALEAAVRYPAPWQQEAVRWAHGQGDPDWVLTAIFAMRYVRGFEDEIVEALDSRDPMVVFHAVEAAGAHGLDEAWETVADLVGDPDTDKDLLLAAIEAAAAIRPEEAADLLVPLAACEDEDILDAVHDALLLVDPELQGLDEEADPLGGMDDDGEYDPDDEDEDDLWEDMEHDDIDEDPDPEE